MILPKSEHVGLVPENIRSKSLINHGRSLGHSRVADGRRQDLGAVDERQLGERHDAVPALCVASSSTILLSLYA